MRSWSVACVFALAIVSAGCAAQRAQGRVIQTGLRSSSSANRATARLQHRSSTAAVRASSAASSVAPTPPEHYRIPILVYHHVRPYEGWGKETWSYKMSITPEAFARQMQWIEDHNYTPITFDTFVKIAKGEIPGPQKPVVITFDDNNENTYLNAFPVLKQHFFTATWYVITSRFDTSDAYITSAQFREMAKAGMDIQSHSVTHPWLTSLSVLKQRWELAESRKAIEAITGKPVRHLAYPLTMRNAQVVQSVRDEGYLTATIMDPRPATEKDDLLVLPRIQMNDDTNLASVLP